MYISGKMKEGCWIVRTLKALLLITVLIIPVTALGGSLDAPTGPTTQGDRHTLKHVYDLLKTGTETPAISGTFSGPPSGPISETLPTTPSDNTLNDIYDASPKPDASGASQSQVCDTKTFWSLLSGNWGLKTGNRDCNRRPVAADDNPLPQGTPPNDYTVDENAVANINVKSNDSDPDGNPIAISGDPDTTYTKGTATKIMPADTVDYSPNSQFNYLSGGEFAVDTFRYTISDGAGGSDTATARVRIRGVNSAPTIPAFSNPYLTINEDTVGSGNVNAFPVTRVDKDLSSLTYSITQAATKGNVTIISSTNAFIYVPNQDENGSDTFRFQACNGAACVTSPIVNITINAVNDPPSFDLISPRDQRAAVGSGTTNVNNFATNISKGPADESTQSLTGFTVTVNDPSGVLTSTPTINTGTGRLSYSVHATNTGIAQLSVTLTDNGGGNDTSPAQVFSITVY